MVKLVRPEGKTDLLRLKEGWRYREYNYSKRMKQIQGNWISVRVSVNLKLSMLGHGHQIIFSFFFLS